MLPYLYPVGLFYRNGQHHHFNTGKRLRNENQVIKKVLRYNAIYDPGIGQEGKPPL
jgi:hypothetical protein